MVGIMSNMLNGNTLAPKAGMLASTPAAPTEPLQTTPKPEASLAPQAAPEPIQQAPQPDAASPLAPPPDTLAVQESYAADKANTDLAAADARLQNILLRQNAYKANSINPDAAARALDLSQKTGVPFDVAVRNTDELSRNVEMDSWSRKLKTNPALTQFVSDPTNMVLAKDDISALSTFEKDVGAFGKNVAKGFTSTGASAVQGAVTLGSGHALTENLFDRIDSADPSLSIKPQPMSNGAEALWFETNNGGSRNRFLVKPGDPLFDYATNPQNRAKIRQDLQQQSDPRKSVVYQKAQQFRDFMSEKLPTTQEQDAGFITGASAQGLGSAGAYVLSTLLVGPEATVGLGITSQAQSGFEDATITQEQSNVGRPAGERESQKTIVDNAMRSAQLNAPLGALELLPAEAIISKVGLEVSNRIGRAFVKAGIGAATEAIEGTAQQVGANIIAQELYEKNRSTFDGLVANAGGGAVAGGVLGLVAGLLSGGHAKRTRSFNNALDKVRDSKLAARSPEKFKEFVDHVMPDETIYLPADQLRTFFQSMPGDEAQGFIDKLGISSNDLNVTGSSNAEIAIPASTYAALIGDKKATPFLEAMQDHIRVGAEGMSISEADEAKKTAEKLLEEAAPAIEERMAKELSAEGPQQQVLADVQSKLTDALLPPNQAKHVAALVAAHYQTVASRFGKDATAWDYYKGSQIEIVGDIPDSLRGLSREQLTAVDQLRKSGKASTKDIVHVDESGDTILDNKQQSPKDSYVPTDQNVKDLQQVMQQSGVDLAKDSEHVIAQAVRAVASKTFNQAAYHGGRHIFDKFSTAKIGTGEGAQVYGWGLYFADLKDVAEHYRDKLLAKNGPQLRARERLNIFNGDVDKAIASIERDRSGVRERYDAKFEYSSIKTEEQLKEAMVEFDDVIKSLRDKTHSGRVYHVEIPDDGDYLLWDKPLSEQSKSVKTALAAVTKSTGLTFKEDQTGENIYKSLVDKLRSQRNASQALLAGNLPGIKYLDQGSVGDSATGTHNYVIFDDSLVQIKSFEQSTKDGPARGQIFIPRDSKRTIHLSQFSNVIHLMKQRDASTVIHEFGHLWRHSLESYALDPDAPQQIKDDWAAIKNALGMKEGQTELTLKQEEHFAKWTERYCMEGEAPSTELQAAFATFKKWFVKIYHILVSTGAPMSSEVREVFDRMFATDEQIMAARESQQLTPIFKTPEEAGWSVSQFDAYMKKYREAEAKQNEIVSKAAMADLRRRETEDWKVKEKPVRDQVTEAVDNGRDMQALNRLGKDIKLDAEAVAAIAEGATLPPSMIAEKDGIDPDMAAIEFGYDTGKQMIDAVVALEAKAKELADAGDKRSIREYLIDEQTRVAMKNIYGDSLTDGTIEEAARAAVHSKDQGDLMITELRAIGAQMTGKTGAMDIKTIRAWAKKSVSSMKVRDGTATDRFLRAERKAGKECQAALFVNRGKGNAREVKSLEKAFKAKQQQIVNFELYRAAKDAKEQLAKDLTVMKRMAGARHIPTIGQDFLDQIHGLLEKIDLRPASQPEVARRKALTAFVAEQEAKGFPVYIPESLIHLSLKQNYLEMTVGDFTDVANSVRSIKQAGKDEVELASGERKVKFEAAKNEIVDEIRKNVPEHGRAIGSKADFGAVRNFGRSVLAAHKKVENLAVEAGGGKRGVFWKHIYGLLNDSGDAKTAMRGEKIPELMKLYDVFSRSEKAEMAKTQWVPELGANQMATKWRLIALALNMGNEGNISALSDANGLTPMKQIEIVNKYLTKKEMDFVQNVWDFVNSFWPQIAELEKRRAGFVPEKIDPRQLVTKHGTYRGGYYPLAADPKLSPKAMARELEEAAKGTLGGSTMRAYTKHGYTYERTGYGKDKPVYLDISVLNKHVEDVIHDLTHREAVMDVHRLLSNVDISAAIRDTFGQQTNEMLQDTIRAIAGNEGAVRDTAYDPVIRGIRNGYVVSRLAFQFVNAAQNYFTNPMLGVSVVGEKRMTMHALPLLANPYAMVKAVQRVRGMSAMMDARYKNSNRDMRDVMNSTDPKGWFIPFTSINLKEIRGVADRWALALPAYTDLAAATATWTAAYNKAMAGEAADAPANDHKEAVSFADHAVRITQGSGLSKDLAKIQRGSESFKLLTAFIGWFVNVYNKNANEVNFLRRGQRKPLRFALNMLWINLLPMLAGNWVANNWPEEDESFAAWFSYSALSWLSAGFVGGRDVVSGFGYLIGQSGGAPKTALAMTTDNAIKFAAGVGKAIKKGEGLSRTTVRAGWNLAGTALGGLAPSQAFKTYDGLSRMADGEDLGPWEALANPPPKK